jgi:hypothetical protein
MYVEWLRAALPPRAPRGEDPQRDGPFMSLETNDVSVVVYVHGPIGGKQPCETTSRSVPRYTRLVDCIIEVHRRTDRSMMLETRRCSCNRMKCCTLEGWFTCEEIGKEHWCNKSMSDKGMRN